MAAPIVEDPASAAPALPDATRGAIAQAPASLSAFPQQVEATSPEVLFSQATPADSTIPADDETFSPLPEPDPEPADTSDEPTVPEVETPTLETPEDETDEAVEETDDEPSIEVEEATPSLEDVPTGEAVPIPVERVADELPYLDPDPNPLLIQTQPEEVEIIGQQPVTLEQAVEVAYRNNPELQIALLELEQSEAALREAQAALFPTVAVSGTLQAQNTTDQRSILQTDANDAPVIGADGNPAEILTTFEELGLAFSAQVQVNYALYTSGQRAASIRAAEEQVRFDELDVELIQENLRLETATNYYNLQIAIESIRINEAFLEDSRA